MTHNRYLAILLFAAAAGCAAPTVEQQLINDAADGLGGRERVLAVRTLVLEGEGTQFNLGQDMRPGASGQTFTVSGLKRQIDLAGHRMRTELTRTPNFAFFQGPAPQPQVQGLDGEVAYNVAPNGNAARVTAQATGDRRADFYHHPIVLVAAALAPGASVANVRSEGAERLADITTDEGMRLVMAVDESGRPTRIESRSYHANLGDVTLSTHFADYQENAGVMLPGHVRTKVDEFTTAEVRFPVQRVDAAIDDLAAPSAVTSAALPTPAAPNVVAEQVAPGVWLLAGQSHHSALVELSDHMLLIEAPQSEERTLAAIARARELQPDKPLTKIVTTHHHFDHTAGIRAAVSEGLTIVTHSGNRAFFEEMAARPHTIVADALSRNPKPVVVETVDDELVIEDPARTVALYHVAGNPHSDTMLMVYLPAERVVIEVDAYSPASQAHPYAANLLDNIVRRKLRVDRVVPLHGAIAPFADLVKHGAAQTEAFGFQLRR
ncbi:MAG TPA: MBL fold metallo-hydrolase [Vicinamibacterales bacterium]|nr:MBL fold metallo-hydrolase [Vicinamibacterales bacterium]